MNETFCGHCNRVFDDGRPKCDCGRDTTPMTDAHRGLNILLLSGSGAATISDPAPPYTDEELRADIAFILAQSGLER